MRYALISDVHAYPPALEMVLADAASHNVGSVICLGDVVGYGPDPAGAVRMCRESCDVVIAGNHDAAVARQISTMNFIPRARDAVNSHRRQLSDADIEWLSSLPMLVERENFAGAHGELHVWRSVMEAGFGYVISAADAASVIDAMPDGLDVAFVGHTHAACVWVDSPKIGAWPRLLPADGFTLEKGRRYVVNIGSVGYPRYHDRTIYVIYDSDERSVEFRQLPFDHGKYLATLEEQGIEPPLWLTDRINGS